VRENAKLRAHELDRCQAIITQRATETARRLAARAKLGPRPETTLVPALELAAMAV